MDAFKVGQRVCYTDRVGTIRFTGALTDIGLKGDWAGIEWDDSDPKYHDGEVKGVRFFSASRPNSSSFVPLSKLSHGMSAAQAVAERYESFDESSGDIGVRFGNKDVVAVGWEKVMKKVSDFSQLRDIHLSGCFVNEDTCDLSMLTPNVEFLRLRRSLISSWSFVMKLIQTLPHLMTLDLSYNRLKLDTSEQNHCVKRIILCGNSLDWNDVVKIMNLFPNLEDVFLGENRISKVSSLPLNPNGRLTTIDLENQTEALEDWEQIGFLGEIPTLKVLHLSENSIRRIVIQSGNDNKPTFPALTTLTLKMNQISEWKSVNELNKLPALHNLKFTHNPVSDSVSPQTARQWIIAKIAGLRVLNQTPISPTERRDSELDYLRHFGSQWLSFSASNESERAQFLEEHPRFLEILEKHGPLEAGELPGPQKHLKDSLLKLTFRCGDVVKARSVPVTLTVMKLKRLLERTFRLSEISVVSYCAPEKENVRYSLDDDLKELSYYDVKSGDIIIIS